MFVVSLFSVIFMYAVNPLLCLSVVLCVHTEKVIYWKMSEYTQIQLFYECTDQLTFNNTETTKSLVYYLLIICWLSTKD